MPDQSDIENSLVTVVATALYPNGFGSPSVTGAEYKVYRGWPNAAALDADLAVGRINITIFPMAEPGRNTTRYTPRWLGSKAQSSLTVSVSGETVTLGGAVVAGLLIGILVNGQSYVYRTKPSDSTGMVIANLAASIREDYIAIAAGNSLTVPGSRNLLGRVVSDASVAQEIRRQEQGFRITCWCSDPVNRDNCAITIDLSLAGIQFITLDDGAKGRLQYRGSLVFDQSQDALLYRRDLIYDIEYPTTIAALQPAMLFGDLVLNADTVIT